MGHDDDNDDDDAAAETNLVEDKAPCADGRRANGDGTCTEAGKDRPFCVRARANRSGGSNGEMCKRKGMRRACPESCMVVEDKAPCADGRRANGYGSFTEAGKDRPFCVRARANRFGGSNDEMCKRKGMRRACPESCMGHGAAAETNLVEDKAPCA